ncbi:hypothetical protein ACJX0J_009474 [Zea mays]
MTGTKNRKEIGKAFDKVNWEFMLLSEISPILFNFRADSLARMMNKAIENNVLKGLGNHLIPNGTEIFVINGDEDITMHVVPWCSCDWIKELIAGRTTIGNLDKKGRSFLGKMG